MALNNAIGFRWILGSSPRMTEEYSPVTDYSYIIGDGYADQVGV